MSDSDTDFDRLSDEERAWIRATQAGIPLDEKRIRRTLKQAEEIGRTPQEPPEAPRVDDPDRK